MKVFSIPNLVSTQVTPLDLLNPTVTDDPKLSKAAWTKWTTDPATAGQFISGFAGLNTNIRVNRRTNAAVTMHALIADYDTTLTEEALVNGIRDRAKPGFMPAFAHLTQSNRGRVIWIFEEPLLLVPGVTETFLRLLKNESGASELFAALDDAIIRPEQYYHLKFPILRISDETISTPTLQFYMAKAVDTNRKYEGEGSIKIPLDKVHEEIQLKWPGRWTGDFTPNARGCCFWDPESVNPTAAIVTETGMVAFSQPHPFYSWSDLLGIDFVRKFEEDKFGRPLADYVHDGKYYWKKSGGEWLPANGQDARHDIIGTYGLSGAPGARGILSEADETLLRIRNTKHVHSIVPMLYCPPGIVRRGVRSILNTSIVEVVPPADGDGGWGVGFPWLAEFLDNFFEPRWSKDFFIAWLHRFYDSAYKGRLTQGHAIFLAGGVSRGKTLMSNIIIGGLMGGFADASSFLLGGSDWNKDLIENPVWAVDDSNAITTYSKHTLWSSMIKKSVANTSHPYNVKFHDTSTVNWNGRIVVSLNDDPESIQQIPHTDGSILDKIMLFRASDTKPEFPSNHVLEATIRAELPYLGRYLLNFVVPKELVSGNRFGIRSFHHPVLLADTHAMSRQAMFGEMIENFIEEYHRLFPEKDYWEGGSTELLRALQNSPELEKVSRHYLNTPDVIGRKLAALAVTGDQVTRLPLRRGFSRWRINLCNHQTTTNGSSNSTPAATA